LSPSKLALTFSPLVLFTLVGHLLGPDVVGWAALVSAVLAVAILVAGLRDGVKLVTLASAVVFGGLAALALLGGHDAATFVSTYGTGVSALLIGSIMLISVMTVPFTEQYARAVVPREAWASAGFRSVNRRISAVWAGVVVGVGLSRLLYGAVNSSGTHVGSVTRLVLTWGIPILLVLAGLKYTKQAASQDEQPHTAQTPRSQHPSL
jgi:hypothetical protein